MKKDMLIKCGICLGPRHSVCSCLPLCDTTSAQLTHSLLQVGYGAFQDTKTMDLGNITDVVIIFYNHLPVDEANFCEHVYQTEMAGVVMLPSVTGRAP